MIIFLGVISIKRAMPRNRIEDVKKAYNNPETGFISAHKLAKKMGLKEKAVEKELDSHQTYRLFKRPNPLKVSGKIIAKENNDRHQADLIFGDKVGLGVCRGYKFILSYIDVHSRKAVCVPIKDKKGTTIASEIEKIWKTALRPPKEFLETDMGTEFTGKNVKKFLLENKVHLHISVFSPHVERFNRTIQGMLTRALIKLKTKNWVKVLPVLVSNYNNTFHRGIKCTPNEAYGGKETKETMVVMKTKQKFNKGDTVRVRTHKNKTAIAPTVRSYLAQWSKEKAIIDSVHKSINGVYYYALLWKATKNRSRHVVPEAFLMKA